MKIKVQKVAMGDILSSLAKLVPVTRVRSRLPHFCCPLLGVGNRLRHVTGIQLRSRLSMLKQFYWQSLSYKSKGTVAVRGSGGGKLEGREGESVITPCLVRREGK